MVTNITDGEQCLTDGDQYFTNVDRCLPNASWGIQCCQPSKSCKNLWKNQKNRTNMSWQHCFRLKTANELPDSSPNIGHIGFHRFYRLSIGMHRWHRWETRCIFGQWQQSQHQLHDVRYPIPMFKLSRIVIGFGRSPSVPGLLFVLVKNWNNLIALICFQ